MSQDNQITLRGYLTQEPRLYQRTPEAVPVTEIRVGSTPRRLNRETGEWQEAPASYYTVKCWRRLAINAASSLHKGDTVIIRGRFYTNTWVDSQQQTRTKLEIEADSLGHDLAYGWSHFLRGVRQQSRDNAGADGGETARQDTGLADEVKDEGEYQSAFGTGATDAGDSDDAVEETGAFDATDADGGLGDPASSLAASEADLTNSRLGLPEAEAVAF
jgi:single-strand DNA-binding protein